MDPAIPGPSDQPLKRADPASAPTGDGDLVAGVLRKDRKAAAQFVAAHIDAVYAYARHRLTPRADLVDDVVQDVFVAALKGLATFQGQSSLRTWLIAIARHKIEDVYRQRLRTPESLNDAASVTTDDRSSPATLDAQIDTARQRAKARRILAAMPERYGMVLLWRYWEQRSTRDIAAATGATEKSVERLLARARASFKALWAEE